ncbi:MAG: hypothetical protein ACNA8W_19135 [Bradymonadaceae bacterium]
MTQLLSRWNVSRERLTELQNNLVHKGQELENKSTVVTGRWRDASLTTIYELGATTLSTAAQWTDKVPGLRTGAKSLRERAEALHVAGASVQQPPIANYDELNVRQIGEALEGLSAYELDKVRRYEEAHKNRVTILRGVERRLTV